MRNWEWNALSELTRALSGDSIESHRDVGIGDWINFQVENEDWTESQGNWGLATFLQGFLYREIGTGFLGE